MKLVFVTQVLDRGDAVLGFVCRWVEGLAAVCPAVRVVALEVGDTHGLPPNVDWRVVGREGRLGRLLRYRRFLREAFGQDGFDGLLTHMVPRYSSLAAPLARKSRVPHALWYTHKGVDGRLRRAIRQVDVVFTASAESMRVDTPKKRVTGHGIDLQHFAPLPVATRERSTEGGGRLLSVGRMTPAKDPLTVLEALARLVAEGREVSLEWAGGGLAAGDAEFGRTVTAAIARLGLNERVRLLGDVPYLSIPERYRAADVYLSASRTGSVDKVVLEAMACGVPAVTCNESFPPIFAALGDADARALVFEHGDSSGLAARVGALLDRSAEERLELGQRLRAIVAGSHEVDALLARLVHELEGLRA